MIDPKNRNDRILMFIPGFLSWTMILMPIWLGITSPRTAAFILTFLSVYWLYMAITHGIGLIRGYFRYTKEIKINWYQKCKELNFSELPSQETLPKSLNETKHLILIPTVKEGVSILEGTFKAIIDSNYPTKNILLVIGTEEIGEQEVKEALNELQNKFKDKMPRIRHFIHPKGIPGEIVGVASPNRTWAAKHAVEQLKKEGEDVKNYIFSTFDSDWMLHKEFLPRLTYEYLTDEKRFNRFYETVVHLFSNNLWQVPLISRVEANNVTLGMLSNWTAGPEYKESFSCYSSALDTLIAADYWDTTMIDDTVFYWRAIIGRNGDFTAKQFYIPIYGDATGGSNYLKAHKNLYKQLVRWGWGSVTTVLALKTFGKTLRHQTSLTDKIMWIFSKVERHLLLRTSAFLITFGFTIITFVNLAFKNSATVYGLPQVLSFFLSIGLLIFIPITYVRIKLYAKYIPKSWPKWKKLILYLEGPAIMINLLTYSFIPFLYAETMMMFGKLPKVTFYTPKTR